MIKKCNECGIKKNYPDTLEVCPSCGGTLNKISVEEYVMYLYDKGLSLKTIAQRTNMNQLLVFNIIDKVLSKKGEIPSCVQTEYIDKIRPLVSERDWDKKLKPVKEKLPKDCTYETIVYVVNLAKREWVEAFKKMQDIVTQMVSEEKTIEEISKTVNTNSYTIEREIINAIREKAKNEAEFDVTKSPYVQAEYMNQILKLATKEWNGELRALKAELPEDCTYVTIKAVLAVNGLSYR